MKKKMSGLLTILLLLPMLMVPESAQAKTLGQLKQELNAAEANYNAKESEERLTQEQINQNNANIKEIQNSMVQIDKEITDLNNEIVKLNEEIVVKDKEMKSILNFVQVSNGESAYMEYAFGAQDFTDFIYRVSISEQLADYNEKLIDDYTNMIEESKKKQVEMKKKTEQLAVKQKELEATVASLKDKMASLSDIKVSIKDEIKLQRAAIKVYENLGCKDSEDIETCGISSGNEDGGPMESNRFYRPIVKGHTTSEYGWRCLDITGCELHSGLDMSVAGGGVPIYAAASGLVIGLIPRASCGGNQVIILHNINGKKYTTLYAHLRTYNVSVGQAVTANTQIGIMGGNPATEYWDKCSTGNHVHFTVATGHYLKDYYSWSTFMNNTVNPRSVLNVPRSGVEFTSRFTQY